MPVTGALRAAKDLLEARGIEDSDRKIRYILAFHRITNYGCQGSVGPNQVSADAAQQLRIVPPLLTECSELPSQSCQLGPALQTEQVLAAFWQPPCVRGGRFTQARCKSLSQDSGLTDARASADRTVAPHVADNSDTVGCSCRRVTQHGIASLGRSRHSLTLVLAPRPSLADSDYRG